MVNGQIFQKVEIKEYLHNTLNFHIMWKIKHTNIFDVKQDLCNCMDLLIVTPHFPSFANNTYKSLYIIST